MITLKPTLFDNRVIAHFSLVENSELDTFAFSPDISDEIIRSNRRNFFSRNGFDYDMSVFCKQIHGDNVVIVCSAGILDSTDGLVTKTQGLTLSILVADCGALLFYDSVNRVVGAAHSGWRGAVSGIGVKVLEKMLEAGADKNFIRIYLGPCISVKAFEVGEEVAEKFDTRFVDGSFEKPHVDLRGFIVNQLISFGINAAHIEVDYTCTKESALCHSYRRDGTSSGRMIASIMLL